MNDALTVVLGGRVDWYEIVRENRDLTTGVTTRQPDYSLDPNFTPYAGVAWDVVEQWSLYASYADIFLPQTTQFTRDGDKLDPIVGANYEAGIKGEVRSEGVEAEVSGSPLPAWNVFAGYTYNTTEYVKDRVNEGKVFMTQTPKHILRLWSTYQLPGDWSRLSFGAGVNAQSGAARAKQDAYAIANARLTWCFNERLSAALNGNNLLDKTYFASVGVGYGNVYGDPRNVMLTLRYRM